MQLVQKDVLWPGSWKFRDGRTLTLTADQIRTAFVNTQEILDSGYDVPWCWEHQRNACPVEMSTALADGDARAEWSKNCFSRVRGLELKSTNRGPVLMASFDKKDLTADELNRVGKAAKVSCWVQENAINPRTGKVYEGYSVFHVAVTPKPVEPNQGKFLMNWIGGGESYFFGDEDDLVELKKAEETKPDPETPTTSESETKPDVPRIVQALREAGWSIPEEVVDTDQLVIAIKAAGMPSKAEDADHVKTESGGSPPMLMSQAAMEKERPGIVKADRRDIERRIKAIVETGRVAPPIGKRLTAQFTGFQLSYANGEVALKGPLSELAAYEKLPAGMVMKPKADGVELSTLAQDRPNELNATVGDVDKTVLDYQEQLALKYSVKKN